MVLNTSITNGYQENGTLSIVPYPNQSKLTNDPTFSEIIAFHKFKAQQYKSKEHYQQHRLENVKNEIEIPVTGMGYGQIYIIVAKAGSLVVMASTLLHCSTNNISSKFRSAFMPQYSQSPIVNPQKELVALALPFPTQ